MAEHIAHRTGSSEDGAGGRSRTSELRSQWRTLLGTSLGAATGVTALYFYTSSVFFAELRDSAGWSPQLLSTIHLLHTLTLAIAAPFCGALIDRFGARRLIAIGYAAEAISFLAMGILPPNFYGYGAIMVAMSLFGVGTSTLGFARVVISRFDASRGLALGITIGGMGVTAFIGPRAMTWAVGAYGWQMGYILLAGCALVAAPIVHWLIGPSPAASPSRPSTAARPAGKPAACAERLPLVLGRPLFWIVVVPFALSAVSTAGYVLHMITLLKGRGVSATEAAGMLSSLGVAVLLGRLSIGWLMDRVFAVRIGSAIFCIATAGLLVLAAAPPGFVYVGLLALGFVIGAELDVLGYLFSRYYPLSDFGRNFGLAYAAIIVTAGMSPLVISTISAASGGYEAALLASAVANLVSAALLMLAPKFPKQAASAVPA